MRLIQRIAARLRLATKLVFSPLRKSEVTSLETAGGESDEIVPIPPFECSDQDTNRWNEEWLRYLGREWPAQLTSHFQIQGSPALPDKPAELIDLRIDASPRMALYCNRADLEDRRIMEMGCGCGNLGKLLGRYVDHYLGVDYSTLALKVAQLVSPQNCSYHHVSDREALEPYFGTIDTIVGRYFWIHQNRVLARYNLEYLLHFLKAQGRIYMDFYWPNPRVRQGTVYTPDHALSRKYPSATFKYDLADVQQLLENLPLRLVSQEIHPGMQRRYVVVERVRG